METEKNKFFSRKFLISLAAFLAALGAGITGVAMGDPTLIKVGAICTVLSAAIYAAMEAYVDGKSVSSKTVVSTISGTLSDKAALKEIAGASGPATVTTKGGENG